MELLDSAPAVRNYPRPLPLPTPDPTTLADTTKEELEIIMKSEIKRFESFDESWPHTQNLPPRRMAAAGLYYKGEGDRVTCAFCRGWLQDWDGNDDPMDEHQKHHSHCRFVLGDEDCGNIPLAPPSPGSDPMDVTRGRRRLYDSYPNCKPVPGGKPAFPTLADSAARLTTFARWPDHTHKQADDLVAAGFYYSLVRDKVRCFYCAVELEQWNMNDIPWLEHARWSPNCEFLIQRRGRFYVDQVEGKQNVKDFIADLRHVAQQKRHSKTFIDEALRNHGVPFDTPQAMRSAVDALDIQDYVLPAIQADDNHNAELLGDGRIYCKFNIISLAES